MIVTSFILCCNIIRCITNRFNCRRIFKIFKATYCNTICVCATLLTLLQNKSCLHCNKKYILVKRTGIFLKVGFSGVCPLDKTYGTASSRHGCLEFMFSFKVPHKSSNSNISQASIFQTLIHDLLIMQETFVCAIKIYAICSTGFTET